MVFLKGQLKSLSTFLIVILVISCGRDISDKNAQQTPAIETEPADIIQEALKVQSLECSPDQSCPEYIAKLSIYGGADLSFCQGTLVDGDVVTAASCLPSWIRFAGANCQNSIVFSFVAKNGAPKNFECDQVEYVSSGLNRSAELWDGDIAILKMKDNPQRRSVRLSDLGINDSNNLYRWFLSIKDLKTGFVKKDNCTRILNNYSNPFADNQDSSLQLLTECGSEEAPLGASLHNNRGRFVGVQSIVVDKKIIRSLEANGLLIEKTAPMSYVSNLGCTDIRLNNYEFKPSGCFSNKSYYELDRRRSAFLNNHEIHRDNVKNLEAELSNSEKYFKWNLKFVPNKRAFIYELKMAKPKCFFGVNNWIKEYRRGNSILTPAYISIMKKDYILKAKLDKYLRAVSFVEELEDREYKVKFNPYTAYVDRETFVAFKASNLDRDYKIVFDDIKECL